MVAQQQSETPHASAAHRPRLLFRPIRGMQVLLAAVIFVSGAIVGGAGTILYLRQRMVWIRPNPGPSPPHIFLLRHLISTLDLTEEQARQVEQMLDQSMQHMHEIVMQNRQHMEAKHEDLASKLKDILTPEQYQKWERDFSQMRRRFRSKGGMGPGRFGPRGFRSKGFPPGRFGPRDFGAKGFSPGRFGPDRARLEPNSMPDETDQEPNDPNQ